MRFAAGDRPVFIIDQSRCIGCEACVQACEECDTHRGRSLIHLETIERRDSVQTAPQVCMHCEDPACLEACPAEGAIYQRPDGIVLMDREKCTGCQACGDACPYNAICFNPGDGRAEKCTLCSHRIDQGLEPFCVKECIWGALRFAGIKGAKGHS